MSKLIKSRLYLVSGHFQWVSILTPSTLKMFKKESLGLFEQEDYFQGKSFAVEGGSNERIYSELI